MQPRPHDDARIDNVRESEPRIANGAARRERLAERHAVAPEALTGANARGPRTIEKGVAGDADDCLAADGKAGRNHTEARGTGPVRSPGRRDRTKFGIVFHVQPRPPPDTEGGGIAGREMVELPQRSARSGGVRTEATQWIAEPLRTKRALRPQRCGGADEGQRSGERHTTCAHQGIPKLVRRA